MTDEQEPGSEGFDPALANIGTAGAYIRTEFTAISRRLTGLEGSTRTYGSTLGDVRSAQDDILRGQAILDGKLQGLYTEIRSGAETASRIEAGLGGIQTNYQELNRRINDMNTSVAALASGVGETLIGVDGVRSDLGNLRDRVSDLESGRSTAQPGFFKKSIGLIYDWFMETPTTAPAPTRQPVYQRVVVATRVVYDWFMVDPRTTSGPVAPSAPLPDPGTTPPRP